MQQTGDEDVRKVDGIGRGEKRAAFHDVVADLGHKHRVLDVVIQRVAVADAIQCQPGRERKNFGEAGM
jgi:hypothetical protein